MNLNIQFPEVTLQVEANETDSVGELKQRMNIISEDELLTFNGFLLSDDVLLNSIGVRDGSIINVIATSHRMIATKRAFSIASASKAISTGGRSIVRCIVASLPSLMFNGAFILAATILSGGIMVGAEILAEKKVDLPTANEIKMAAREIRDTAMSTTNIEGFAGAKTLFDELFRSAYAVGVKMFNYTVVVQHKCF